MFDANDPFSSLRDFTAGAGQFAGDQARSKAYLAGSTPTSHPCATKAELSAWFKGFAAACKTARGPVKAEPKAP